MMDTTPYIMKFHDWPAQDRDTWQSLFREDNLLDDPGAGVSWSAGTRRKFAQSYGHWLAFLDRAIELYADGAPADRINLETVHSFYEDTRKRVSFISTSSQLCDLQLIASALDPTRDWTWFKRIANKLRHDPAHRELKPRPNLSSSDIYEWAKAEIAIAEDMHDDGFWERPIRFRDGLMVALLIARPLRLRAFIGMTVNQHLVRRGEGFDLRLRAKDMKDRKARDFTLPDELVEPVERYLKEFRPLLLACAETQMLWVSRRKGALSYNGFQRHLCNITSRAFGEAINPHAFRHIAATSIAEEDPAHVNIIASVLGHATLTMSERHYNRANGVRAASAWQGLIRDRRKQATREQRARVRIEWLVKLESQSKPDAQQ